MNTNLVVAQDEPGLPGTALRHHAEQTTLERVLRSHLWQPQHQLERDKENLPKHVRRKEYSDAAGCQERIWKCESEIKDWEYLLELYEQERQSLTIVKT